MTSGLYCPRLPYNKNTSGFQNKCNKRILLKRRGRCTGTFSSEASDEKNRKQQQILHLAATCIYIHMYITVPSRAVLPSKYFAQPFVTRRSCLDSNCSGAVSSFHRRTREQWCIDASLSIYNRPSKSMVEFINTNEFSSAHFTMNIRPQSSVAIRTIESVECSRKPSMSL